MQIDEWNQWNRKRWSKKTYIKDLNIIHNKIKFIVHMLKSNQIDSQTTSTITTYVLKTIHESIFIWTCCVRRNWLYFQFYCSIVYLLLLRRADAKYHNIESKTINCGTRCLMSFSFTFFSSLLLTLSFTRDINRSLLY